MDAAYGLNCRNRPESMLDRLKVQASMARFG
jgi:hypothetical protein